MTREQEGSRSRPVGVIFLSAILCLLGVMLACAGAAVASSHPDQIFTLPSILYLGHRFLLPVIWFVATGAGLFMRRNWARSSFFAMAALTLVILAGTVTRKLEPGLLAAVIGVGVFMIWGVYYLLGDKIKSWFL